MSLLAILVLLLQAWLCFSTSPSADRAQPRFAPVTPPAPVDAHTERWLQRMIAPVGDVTPGMLNLFNFTRPEGLRLFYLYVPRSYTSARAYPLSFYFHGYGDSWTQGIYFNMTADAERMGYLMAFGQGTPAGPFGYGWEAGLCCLYNDSTVVDDVAYTRAALKLVQGAVNVDPARVYTTGWSNGGFMTERLACQAPELFAGAASDAGGVIISPGGLGGLASCDRSFGNSALNFIRFHGTADLTTPWTGFFVDGVNVLPGVLEDTARWVTRMDCDARVVSTYNDGVFSNIEWPECRRRSRVQLMSVRGGVHWWWTPQQGGFNTTAYILDWFTRTYEARKAERLSEQ